MVPLPPPPIAPRTKADRNRHSVPAAHPRRIFLQWIGMAKEQNFLASLTASRPFRAPPPYSLHLRDHAALDGLHIPDHTALPAADSLHAPGHAALEATDGVSD